MTRKGQFKKNNKLGFKPIGDNPLDSKPLTVRLRQGQLEKLKAVPNWQERLRELVDQLITENPTQSGVAMGRDE
jgi:hypothetical protein